MKLTQHFSLEEFSRSATALRRHIVNQIPQQLIAPLRALCEQVLEPLRQHFGPIVVTSGYRSPSLNRAVGGTQGSQHMAGEAADIISPSVGRATLFQWMRTHLPYDQLILEPTWIHVSYRQGHNRRQTINRATRTPQPQGP